MGLNLHQISQEIVSTLVGSPKNKDSGKNDPYQKKSSEIDSNQIEEEKG